MEGLRAGMDVCMLLGSDVSGPAWPESPGFGSASLGFGFWKPQAEPAVWAWAWLWLGSASGPSLVQFVAQNSLPVGTQHIDSEHNVILLHVFLRSKYLLIQFFFVFQEHLVPRRCLHNNGLIIEQLVQLIIPEIIHQ